MVAHDERITIGRFGRAHGVRGEVRFFSQNPESDFLKVGLRVFVRRDGQETVLTVAKVRHAAKFDIVGLEDIDGRDQAEALTNLDVSVDREALPELEQGEFYLRDLVGCEVAILIDEQGATRPIGQVGGFFETGANDVMVVEFSGGETLFVPMVDHAVAAVDPDQGVVLYPLEQWAPEGTVVPD